MIKTDERGMERVPGSFRDPSGSVYQQGDCIIRSITSLGQKEWQQFLSSGLLDTLQERALLQYTQRVPLDRFLDIFGSDVVDVVEHRRIPFISYPYEWSFEMLKDAALAHLQLLQQCIQKAFVTKDGTSYNIQFLGTRPIFIDPLSIIPYQTGTPWLGYRQFCQLFLFPLFLYAYKGIPFQPILRSDLEGFGISLTRKLFSAGDVFKRGILMHVFVQSLFDRTFSGSTDQTKHRITSSGFIRLEMIQRNVESLQRLVGSLSGSSCSSSWENYQDSNSYKEKDRLLKQEFVERAVKLVEPPLLCDLGCNTGEYSIIASRFAKYVVAIDEDQPSIDRLYRELKARSLGNILPLVMNIVNPSPNQGWRLKERGSFFSRESPDMVLCLALVHHMVIGNNIPLDDVVNWMVEYSSNIVFEFVTKDDPMVRRLLLNKDDTYREYTIEHLEHLLRKSCHIQERQVLSGGTRILYFLRKGI